MFLRLPMMTVSTKGTAMAISMAMAKVPMDWGCMDRMPGSVISAIVLTVLPEALREVADYRMLVYAIVLILVMQATNNPTMKRFFASAKEKLTPGRKERAAL